MSLKPWDPITLTITYEQLGNVRKILEREEIRQRNSLNESERRTRKGERLSERAMRLAEISRRMRVARELRDALGKAEAEALANA